jgi:hypothetical protein
VRQLHGSVDHHYLPVSGLTCVEVCFVHPNERSVVAAAGQAGRFQAFDKVFNEPENGNAAQLLSLFPKVLRKLSKPAGNAKVSSYGLVCRRLVQVTSNTTIITIIAIVP